MGNKLSIIVVIYYIAVKQTFDCNHILKEKGIMSRIKLFVLSLLLVSFLFCTLGTSSYAQEPTLQGPTLGGPLKLTPLEPVDPRLNPDIYSYQVFRATPHGVVFILKGNKLGERDNILCVNRPIAIDDYEIENILVANRYGFATAEIIVPDVSLNDALYMQALDARKCKISNVTEFLF